MTTELRQQVPAHRHVTEVVAHAHGHRPQPSIVISSGTGPYWAGKVSTMTGSLTAGLLSMMALAPIALVLLWLAATVIGWIGP